jgi:hypothetical protein
MENYESVQYEQGKDPAVFSAEQEEPECINYYPGLLAELEDELTEAKEREFERLFFCGC